MVSRSSSSKLGDIFPRVCIPSVDFVLCSCYKVVHEMCSASLCMHKVRNSYSSSSSHCSNPDSEVYDPCLIRTIWIFYSCTCVFTTEAQFLQVITFFLPTLFSQFNKIHLCLCLTFLYFCEGSASVQLLSPESEGWVKESQHFKLPFWQADLHHIQLFS